MDDELLSALVALGYTADTVIEQLGSPCSLHEARRDTHSRRGGVYALLIEDVVEVHAMF